MLPEDFKKGAGEKFKIGDIVTVKKDEYRNRDSETYVKERLYIVRWLPRKVDGSPYFENKYALISNYYDGLFTHEERENNIEKYKGKVDPESSIGFLQRIIKNEVAVTKETWNDLKTGKVLLDDRENYKDLYEFRDGDSWGFYSNILYKRCTGLVADLVVSFGSFYTPIKDRIPKIRVHGTKNYKEDFYITISKNPKVIIGKNNLLKKDFEEIRKFIIKNYEGLIEYWNSDCQMDSTDLYELVKINNKKEKKNERSK